PISGFYDFFFFQAEDGIRDFHVTGVQTCALPIYSSDSVCNERKTRVVKQGFLNSRYEAEPQVSADLSNLTQEVEVKDQLLVFPRSEERRVGKECRCRWSPER